MLYYKLNTPDVSAEYFENEILSVNIKTGRYHSVLNSGADYLRLLLDGNSNEMAINKIADVYCLDKDTIKGDFNLILEDLLKNEIIVESNNSVKLIESVWLTKSSREYTKPLLEVHTDMEDLVLLS